MRSSLWLDTLFFEMAYPQTGRCDSELFPLITILLINCGKESSLCMFPHPGIEG